MGNCEHNMGLALIMTVEPKQTLKRVVILCLQTTAFVAQHSKIIVYSLFYTYHANRLSCQRITDLRFFTTVKSHLLRELLHDKI